VTMPEENEIDNEFVIVRNASIMEKAKKGIIELEGFLKKRNEFYIKQERYFVLTRDGCIKYYKDKTLQRGSFLLDKTTKITNPKKGRLEIVMPRRTFILFNSGSKEETVTVDMWFKSLNKMLEDF
jgi:predicted homoserine dehydrogenase-like protein